MDALAYLQHNGYDPQTKNLSMQWICTTDKDGRVQTFFGQTEKAAIERAVACVRKQEAARGVGGC